MMPNRRLKQARELRGWSQAKVAEQIGTDATTVSRWERGMFSPTPYFRERLCALFDKNAEELGLLDAANHKSVPTDNQSSIQSSDLYPVVSTREKSTRELTTGTREALYPSPPSWAQKNDTFEFIVSSATHDQQAHMLWEHAYVQALRGQYTEARQLGEASLSAFEDVGHTNNATAVREWLNRHNQLFSANSPKTDALVSSGTPIKRKKSSGRARTGKGMGLALLLIMVAGFVLSGFAFSQWHPSAQALPVVPHPLPTDGTRASQPTTGTTSSVQVSPTATSTTVPTATTQPTATATLPATAVGNTPTSQPDTASLDLTVKVAPLSLGPNDSACVAEPSSFDHRCTIVLTLFSSSSDTFNWQVRANNSIPATFNPSSGKNASNGMQIQVIIYVQDATAADVQQGQFVFTFTSPNVAGGTYVVSANWHN